MDPCPPPFQATMKGEWAFLEPLVLLSTLPKASKAVRSRGIRFLANRFGCFRLDFPISFMECSWMICLFLGALTLLGLEQSIHWKLLFDSIESNSSLGPYSNIDNIVCGGLIELLSILLDLVNVIAVEYDMCESLSVVVRWRTWHSSNTYDVFVMKW